MNNIRYLKNAMMDFLFFTFLKTRDLDDSNEVYHISVTFFNPEI